MKSTIWIENRLYSFGNELDKALEGKGKYKHFSCLEVTKASNYVDLFFDALNPPTRKTDWIKLYRAYENLDSSIPMTIRDYMFIKLDNLF